jgi:hypothetical protein
MWLARLLLVLVGLPRLSTFGSIPKKEDDGGKCDNMPQLEAQYTIDCCEIKYITTDNMAGPFEIALCETENHSDPYVLPHDEDFQQFDDGAKVKVRLEETTSLKPLSDTKLWTITEVMYVFPSKITYTNPNTLPDTDERSAIAVYATYAGADPATADSCIKADFEDAAFGERGWAHQINASSYGITTFPRSMFQWVRGAAAHTDHTEPSSRHPAAVSH